MKKSSSHKTILSGYFAIKVLDKFNGASSGTYFMKKGNKSTEKQSSWKRTVSKYTYNKSSANIDLKIGEEKMTSGIKRQYPKTGE